MGAGPGDALLFCGSGATAAARRLQEALGVAPCTPALRDAVRRLLRPEERWVVFVGPYEHHSNLLSWRRSLADVVEVPTGVDGLVDLAALRSTPTSPCSAPSRPAATSPACSPTPAPSPASSTSTAPSRAWTSPPGTCLARRRW